MVAAGPEQADKAVVRRSQLQIRLADHCLALGHADAARTRYRRVLAALEPADRRHPLRSLVLGRMALTEATAGRYAEARQWQCDALDCDEPTPVRLSRQALSGLHNLAEIQRRSGDFLGALQVSRRVLELRLEDPHRDPEALAISFSNIAEQFRQSGRFREAEALLREALDTLGLNARGDLHAGLLNNLALVQVGLGRDELALGSFREAIESIGRCPGLAPGVRGSVFNNLASLLHRLGHLALARTLYQRAVDTIDFDLCAAPQPLAGLSLANLACVELDLGNRDQASRLCGRAEVALGRDIGPVVPETEQAWRVLEACYRGLGAAADAARALRRISRGQATGRVAAGGPRRY